MTRPLKHSIPVAADWYPTTDMDHVLWRLAPMCEKLHGASDEHDMAVAVRVMRRWIRSFEKAREKGSRLTP